MPAFSVHQMDGQTTSHAAGGAGTAGDGVQEEEGAGHAREVWGGGEGKTF